MLSKRLTVFAAAGLFALGACAAEEPEADEAVIEDPVIEEPATVEPAVEEPVVDATDTTMMEGEMEPMEGEAEDGADM